MGVPTADDFYSIMGVLTREIIEFGMDGTENLIAIICEMEPFPFPHLNELRERYMHNIRPLRVSNLKDLVTIFSSSVQKLLIADPTSTTINNAMMKSTTTLSLSSLSTDMSPDSNKSAGTTPTSEQPRQPPQTFLDNQFVVAAWTASTSAPSNISPNSRQVFSKSFVIYCLIVCSLYNYLSIHLDPSSRNCNSISPVSPNNGNFLETILRHIHGSLSNNNTNDNYNNELNVSYSESGPRNINNSGSTSSSIDLSLLKKKYQIVRHRQQQAQVIISGMFDIVAVAYLVYTLLFQMHLKINFHAHLVLFLLPDHQHQIENKNY